MEFKLLGSLQVDAADGGVSLPAAGKPRALLAVMLLHAGEILSADRLIDDLWGGKPPASARKVLQTYVLQLRRALGSELVVTEPGGYRLAVRRSEVDAHRFEELIVSARSADGAMLVSERLRAAASLWRGAALADFVGEPFALPEIARLERLRLTALEQRIDADLSLGRHGQLLGELETLVAEQPFAEKFRGQLMIALYRCGRQADALSVYRRGREQLVDELGIEPGLPLRELERAILHQDATLEAPTPAQPIRAPDRGPRPAGNRFVGRQQELDAVLQLIQASNIRLVTLTGPGGAGKTRLVLSVLDRLASAPTIGSAVFVDLAPVAEPDGVIDAIGRAVGIRQLGRDVDAASLVEFLRHQQLLLVLDNFEQVISAGPLVSQLLAGTTAVRVIVTSRLALEVTGEHVFAVAPLAVPTRDEGIAALAEVEAVALFVDRAQMIRPEFELTEQNATSVALLCVRLGGLPLALELAAARAGLLSPRAMLARIDRSLDLLKTRSTRIPERHRTLRATIGWSYDLLAPDEQEFFDELSVFRGGFTVEQAESVRTDNNLDAVDAVDNLVRANLIYSAGAPGDEPRFHMLEIIREYAAEGLARRGRTHLVAERHAMTFMRFAEYVEPLLRGPDQTRCLQLLDAEIDNVWAALSWAEHEGEIDIGLRTGAALWRFWQIRGYLDEARLRVERLLEGGAGSAAARAAGQLTIAECAFIQGDMPTLEKFSASCIVVFRQLGDDHALGLTTLILGVATARSGNAEHGVSLLEEALSIARRAHDAWLEMQVLLYIGMVLTVHDQISARHALQESLRGAQEIGDNRSLAAVLVNLGNLALAGGDPHGAGGWFDRALAVQRALGDIFTIASLHGLAAAHLELGDRNTARQFIDESITIARDAHDRPGIASGLELMARLCTMAGQPERAAQLYGSASVFGRALTHRTGVVGNEDIQVRVLPHTLGQERLAELWAAGRAMSLDDAVTFALTTTTVSTRSHDRDGSLPTSR